MEIKYITKYYGVTCDMCGKHICFGNYPALKKEDIIDAKLPENAIRCPYCDFRSVYLQNRLEFFFEPCDTPPLLEYASYESDSPRI